MKGIFISIFFIHLFLFSIGQQKEVPFTLADRDRIIRTEVRIGSVEKEIINLRSEFGSFPGEMGSLREEMDCKIELLSAKIGYLFWLQGVIITLIVYMFGYIMWDRRSVLIRQKQINGYS